jgi:hypothetical protein
MMDHWIKTIYLNVNQVISDRDWNLLENKSDGYGSDVSDVS